MADLQIVFRNGQKFLENRRTILLGISPGNPHYYKKENLQKLFSLVKDKSDKVLLFLPDKLTEHNFKAVGSTNPEKSARANVNRLRNKCKDVMKQIGCDEEKFSFVKWVEDVEPCPAYTEAFQSIRDLYQENEKFRFDIQEMTQSALTSIQKNREKVPDAPALPDDTSVIDIEEGAIFLQKEIAFFMTLPRIYANCEEFVFVYHLPCPVLEKYCCGVYDGIVKPFIGIVVVH
ncbi:uncharacterized protein LOC116297342 [Actinia tenebrosa]|uniref:Uncharacterized protein LOC116297342 n=1 Tax=Actinia tenebrosa TaxID=6105 RepID=A0A6P8HYH4_ACTTE|nr:uncharacterized protein LOC116297342 [Actinia tenebrosa]